MRTRATTICLSVLVLIAGFIFLANQSGSAFVAHAQSTPTIQATTVSLSCSSDSPSTCTGEGTWSAAFSDAGYVITCTPEGGAIPLSTYNKSTSGFSVTGTGFYGQPSVADCIAVHP